MQVHSAVTGQWKAILIGPELPMNKRVNLLSLDIFVVPVNSQNVQRCDFIYIRRGVWGFGKVCPVLKMSCFINKKIHFMGPMKRWHGQDDIESEPDLTISGIEVI